jgi:hypothetical protein
MNKPGTIRPATLISDAKSIAKKYEARGAIIILFDKEEGYDITASYGATREECRALGKTLDYIVDNVLNVIYGKVYQLWKKVPHSGKPSYLTKEEWDAKKQKVL